MIELALKQSTKKAEVGFTYYDSIIESWYKNGCTSVEKINEYVERYYSTKYKSENDTSQNKNRSSSAPSATDLGKRKYSQSKFPQREYDPKEFDRFMESITE
jgi:DNA replication protein DnaD